MTQIMFRKNVSKGSKFNQIYIPKDMENDISVGDYVEVKLLKKHQELHYSNNKIILSDFKKRLIKDLFSEIKKYKEIKSTFIVGSFLTKIVGYNDIDILLITKNKVNESYEKKINNELTIKFNQNFHIITYTEKQLTELLEICPLTISMFTNFVSNIKFKLKIEKRIDKKHIKFLLMMPEDILDIRMPGRVYLQNVRRLITIERFLKSQALENHSIQSDIKKKFSQHLIQLMEQNDELNNKELRQVRKYIQIKINKIKTILKNGKKRRDK